MFTIALGAATRRSVALAATASVAVLLSACGGGTGSATYSFDSAGNLTSASATTKLANGSTQTTTVSTAPATTSGSTTTTTTTGTTTTTAATTTGTTTGTTSTATSTTPQPYGLTGTTYTLAFSDEFNGTALDTTKWNDNIWYETSNATKNYAVSNGTLKIWPQRDATGAFFNRTIDTDGKYTQTYGFFEIEAKLPVGKGTWPAFWLFNHDLPAYPSKRPEIDIMEAYAGGGVSSGWSDANYHPTAFASTIWLDAGNLAGTKTILTSDLSAAFHKYALKWESGMQTFYFDGQPVYSKAVSMGDPMFLMLDLWYGSASGQPDSTTPTGSTNSYEINYVRAWKM